MEREYREQVRNGVKSGGLESFITGELKIISVTNSEQPCALALTTPRALLVHYSPPFDGRTAKFC